MLILSLRLANLVSVKKGKARKYLKVASDWLKKKPRTHTKYVISKLTDFKKAKTANTLEQFKLVKKAEAPSMMKPANVEMRPSF